MVGVPVHRVFAMVWALVALTMAMEAMAIACKILTLFPSIKTQQDLQPEPALLWWRARISFTNFNGRFLIAAGKKPSVLNENAAAQRVNGRSQAVAFRNSFCSALFMDVFLLDGPASTIPYDDPLCG
jgi:hypothetical protein